MTDDCQTQAETFVFRLVGFVRLAKRIENERQKIGANARAVVVYFQPRVRSGAFEADFDSSFFAGEFDGVREQIPDDLLQALRVAADKPDTLVKVAVQTNAFGGDCRRDRLNRRVNDGAKFDWTSVNVKFSRPDTRNIQQIFDKLRLRPRAALDDGERVPGFLLRRAFLFPANSSSRESC